MGITISTHDCPDEFKRNIKQKEKYLNSKGINYFIDENINNKYTFFNINFDNQKYYGSKFNEIIAGLIAEFIIEKIEVKLIKGIVNSKYSEFSETEKTDIKNKAIEYLEFGNNNISKYVRKKDIIKEVLSYFKENKSLNLEGFIRFRLKKYVKKLNIAVEKSVDDIIIDKEYNEFIELLKYFVELQEPRINLVNVIKTESDSYDLLDEKENKIDNEYLETCIRELMDEEVEFEDLLISALINISPREIILHFKDPEIEKTLKSIFSDRIKICKGCSLCFCKIKT